VEALLADLAAAKERHLRLMADFDNMRKRQARELEERTARANERLLNALLPVFDNFEMALTMAQEETPFVQGVKMIAGEFRKVLEQSGAEVIDAPEGTAFDPMAHEALSMVPHGEIAQGCVVNQFRKGWKLGGKVVRPAQVIVSAGAPAEAVQEA
jgi:molecular chaperone GrpE